jgi:hypothetical protein
MSAKIALVKMIPVQYYSWLSTDLGLMNFSEQDRNRLADYQATIEDYGVEFSAHFFQYVTLAEAIRQAAEHVNAQIVFATLPKASFHSGAISTSRAPLGLSRQQRELIEQPKYDFDLIALS